MDVVPQGKTTHFHCDKYKIIAQLAEAECNGMCFTLELQPKVIILVGN